MRSSTSSSDLRLHAAGVVAALLLGLVLASLVGAILEMRMRQIGLGPGARDSRELWAAQRARASELGDEAIILVGDSRILLDVDLDTLAAQTGLQPVQLAIDGSRYMRVLEDLADDPSITGTVLIGAGINKMRRSAERDRADEWVEFFNDEYRGLWSPPVETRLKAWVQGWSAIYANEIPWNTLWLRLVNPGTVPTRRYLRTYANRNRDADYRLVKQPEFYVKRVLSQLGRDVDRDRVRNLDDFDRAVREVLRRSPRAEPSSPETFEHVNGLIDRMQRRGARVVAIRMPCSRSIREIEEHRHPRAGGWDVFAATTRAKTLHFADHAELQFYLPDGSHLDVRDKAAFTRALAALLVDDIRSAAVGRPE